MALIQAEDLPPITIAEDWYAIENFKVKTLDWSKGLIWEKR